MSGRRWRRGETKEDPRPPGVGVEKRPTTFSLKNQQENSKSKWSGEEDHNRFNMTLDSERLCEGVKSKTIFSTKKTTMVGTWKPG
jgi:hypothetical protein